MKRIYLLCLLSLSIMGYANGQVNQNFCERLNSVIKEAENGTFINLRANHYENTDRYDSKISLISNALIVHTDIGWSFFEELPTSYSQANNYYTTLTACLPKEEWTICKLPTGWTFKNLKTRVFINLTEYKGESNLRVYFQEESDARCLWGNCVNGYGSYLYESMDVYSGDFINGYRNGWGEFTWNLSGQSYEGFWLNGRMNGEAAIFNSDSSLIRSGFMFENRWIDVDTAKVKVFTMGNTTNGFGMTYNNGTYQIGTFKDGKISDMILSHSKNTVIGNYQNQFSGFQITYYPNRDSFYGNTENGELKGFGIKYFSDGTKFEGNFNGASIEGRRFDSNDFFTQKESYQSGVLTVDNSISSKNLVKFAQSLSHLCVTSKDELIGAAINESEFTYKSIFLLDGAAKTEITEALTGYSYSVMAKMNATKLSKVQALNEYKALIEKVKSCTSSSWKGEEFENKDDNTSTNRSYSIQNSMYNYSLEIRCELNDVYLIIY